VTLGRHGDSGDNGMAIEGLNHFNIIAPAALMAEVTVRDSEGRFMNG